MKIQSSITRLEANSQSHEAEAFKIQSIRVYPIFDHVRPFSRCHCSPGSTITRYGTRQHLVLGTCGVVSHMIECTEWTGECFETFLRKLHFKFCNPKIFSKIFRVDLPSKNMTHMTHENFPSLYGRVGHLLGRCAPLISL